MKEIGGKIRLGYRITQWEWQAWKTEEGLWVNGADIIQDIIFTVYRHNKSLYRGDRIRHRRTTLGGPHPPLTIESSVATPVLHGQVVTVVFYQKLEHIRSSQWRCMESISNQLCMQNLEMIDGNKQTYEQKHTLSVKRNLSLLQSDTH